MRKTVKKIVNAVKHHDIVHIEVVINLTSVIFVSDDGKVYVDKAQRRVLKEQGITEEIVDAIEVAVQTRWIRGEMPLFDLRPVLTLNKPVGEP